MIATIKDKVTILYKSKIAINGIWLYLLQIFNTVIPLITLPYITRVLGPSQYGIFSSALNFVGYLQIVVEYGFNLTGARRVAIAKEKNEISEIYSRITITKLMLFIATFCAMITISLFINISRTQFICMVILFSMVLGTAIQQTWLFQGMQEMKYITIGSVISKTISVSMIFLLINSSEQVYLYCCLYSLTLLLMGVISIFIVRFKFNIKFKKIRVRDILDELKDGWYLFTTSAMTKIFSGIGITVLTFTSSDRNVGIYSAVQKIPLIITMIYAPIGQVIYPYVSKHYANSFQKGVNIVKKVAKFIIPSIGIISIGMILFSESIINILYGPEYSTYSLLLIPLIFWMILSILNNLLGVQILVASGHLKEYSISFRIGVIAILLFNLSLGPLGGMYGVSIAAMLAELTLTVAILFQLRRISEI